MHKKFLYTFLALAFVASASPLSAMDPYEEQVRQRVQKVEAQIRRQDELSRKHGKIFSTLSEAIKYDEEHPAPSKYPHETFTSLLDLTSYCSAYDDQLEDFLYKQEMEYAEIQDDIDENKRINADANKAKHPKNLKYLPGQKRTM